MDNIQSMLGNDDPADLYRRRKMMQTMLEKGAVSPGPVNNAAPMSAMQPLGQIANAAASVYNQHQMDAEKQGSMPAPGMTGPPPDPDMLKQLMARFGMGG